MVRNEFIEWAKRHDWAFVEEHEFAGGLAQRWLTSTGHIVYVEFRKEGGCPALYLKWASNHDC